MLEPASESLLLLLLLLSSLPLLLLLLPNPVAGALGRNVLVLQAVSCQSGAMLCHTGSSCCSTVAACCSMQQASGRQASTAASNAAAPPPLLLLLAPDGSASGLLLLLAPDGLAPRLLLLLLLLAPDDCASVVLPCPSLPLSAAAGNAVAAPTLLLLSLLDKAAWNSAWRTSGSGLLALRTASICLAICAAEKLQLCFTSRGHCCQTKALHRAAAEQAGIGLVQRKCSSTHPHPCAGRRRSLSVSTTSCRSGSSSKACHQPRL
jgi:hypothetical protein